MSSAIIFWEKHVFEYYLSKLYCNCYSFTSCNFENLGRKVAVATVTHTEAETQFVSGLVAQKIFGMARKGSLKLPGWPDFNKAVATLQQPSAAFEGAHYEVCQALADGTLVIKQCLLDLYMTKHPEFRDVTEKALEEHNAEFNENGLTAGGEEEQVQNGGTDIPTTSLTFSSKENAEEIINMEDASHGFGWPFQIHFLWKYCHLSCFFVSGYIMYRPCPSAQEVLPEGTFNFMATKNNIFSVWKPTWWKLEMKMVWKPSHFHFSNHSKFHHGGFQVSANILFFVAQSFPCCEVS